MDGSPGGNRTRISALKGQRANRCTTGPWNKEVYHRKKKPQPSRPGLSAYFRIFLQLPSAVHLGCDVRTDLLHRFADSIGIHHVVPRQHCFGLPAADPHDDIFRNASVDQVDGGTATAVMDPNARARSSLFVVCSDASLELAGLIRLDLAPPNISAQMDRSRPRSNNLPQQMQRAFPSTTVHCAGVSRCCETMNAALECPRGRPRSSNHWLVVQGRQGVEANAASTPDENVAKSLQARPEWQR
jgi:hypothetical protein